MDHLDTQSAPHLPQLARSHAMYPLCDDEIRMFIKYYFYSIHNIKYGFSANILEDMIDLDWQDNQDMRTILQYYHRERIADLKDKIPVEDQLLVPVNMSQDNWLLLYLRYQHKTASIIRVDYFDPYSHKVRDEVTDAIQQIYPDIHINNISQTLDSSPTDYGFWIVVATRYLLSNKPFSFENLGINSITQRNVELRANPSLCTTVIGEQPATLRGRRLTGIQITKRTLPTERTPLLGAASGSGSIQTFGIIDPPNTLFNKLPTYHACINWVTRRHTIASISPLTMKPTITAFFDGAAVFTGKLWPTAFLALTLHDLFMYGLHPNDRYGIKISDILSGTATNQATLTSQYGSDLADRIQYATAPIVLTLLPILCGLIAMMHHAISHRLDLKEALRYLKRMSDNKEKWLGAIIFTKNERALIKAHDEIIWGRVTNLQEREELLKQLINTTKKARGLAQLYAISLLADIADSFPARDIRGMQASEQTLLLNLKQTAVKVLEDLSHPTNKLKRKPQQLLATYQLWTLGHKTSVLTQLFWLFPMYVLYANARLLQMVINKIHGASDYANSKQACEADGNIFSYNQWWGDIVCTKCDHLPVYITDQYTAETCMRGLLRSSQTVPTIASALVQLDTANNITSLNFSQQNFALWSQQDWRTILYPINQSYNLASISIASNDAINLSSNIISDLANILGRQNLQFVNVTNLGISANDVSVSTALWKNSTRLDTLDYTGNKLGCAGLDIFLSSLPDSIKTLILARNALDGSCLPNLAVFVKNHGNLTKLVIDNNNNIYSTALTDFYTALQGSNLSTLSSVGIVQTPVGMQSLSTSWPPNLNSVNFAEARLDDNSLPLVQPNIEQLGILNLANNYFSGVGLSQFLQNLVNHNIKIDTLILAGNNSLSGQTNWISLLAKLGLNSLDLSGTDIQDSDFTTLIPIILTIPKVNLANTPLSLQSLIALANACEQSSHNVLTELNWSSNHLDATANSYLQKLLLANITTLDVSNNFLDDTFANDAAVAFHDVRCHMQNINLASNEFTLKGIQVMIKSLPGSSITQLILDNNPIGLPGAQMIASTWIKPVTPYLESDGWADISIDELRALAATTRNTNVTTVSMRNTGLTTEAARLVCRTAWRAGISVDDLNLSENDQINADELDILTCTEPLNSAAATNFMVPMPETTYVPVSNEQLQLLTSQARPTNQSQHNALWLASAAFPLALGAIVMLIIFHRYALPSLKQGYQRIRAWHQNNTELVVETERPVLQP